LFQKLNEARLEVKPPGIVCIRNAFDPGTNLSCPIPLCFIERERRDKERERERERERGEWI